MSYLGRVDLRFLIISLILIFAFGPTSAVAAPTDYETVGGHFFGQDGGENGYGFGISDIESASFWETYRQLGGAEVLGIPISRRFVWNSRPTQVFQRAVLQFDPLEKRVVT